MDSFPLSEQTLDLALKIKSGEILVEDLPAVKVMFVNDGYQIKDGRHRILALKLNGIETIKSKVFIPKVEVKKKERKRRIRHKIHNAVVLFEKTMGLEVKELKKYSSNMYEIKSTDYNTYSVNLSTGKVKKCYPDIE